MWRKFNSQIWQMVFPVWVTNSQYQDNTLLLVSVMFAGVKRCLFKVTVICQSDQDLSLIFYKINVPQRKKRPAIMCSLEWNLFRGVHFFIHLFNSTMLFGIETTLLLSHQPCDQGRYISYPLPDEQGIRILCRIMQCLSSVLFFAEAHWSTSHQCSLWFVDRLGTKQHGWWVDD